MSVRIVIILLFSACIAQANASIKAEKLSRYGNPSYYYVNGVRYQVLNQAVGYEKEGIASWYGKDFHGELTSNRERYDMYAMTAASKELPLPTTVRVTNLENGREIIVRVNDRGPFYGNRLIDLSYAAAKKLGFSRKGTAKVRVTAITSPILENDHPAKHFIQIGVFSNQNNASRFKTQLLNLTDFPIQVTSQEKDEQTLYRVQIGPFNDSDRLREEQNNLKTLGFDHTIAILG